MPTKPTKTSETTDDSSLEFNREEEYRAAQRAAVESIMVGRETLEAAVRQGEQLQNAENFADETEYKLDRATRLLKGMTWAGWFANKWTNDVEPPEYKTKPDVAERQGPPRVYEDVPKSCLDIAQAVQNYHCNVDVLEECETDNQRETLITICNNMYNIAQKKALHALEESEGDRERDNYIACLRNDLETLRSRQKSSERLSRVGPTSTSNSLSLDQRPNPSSNNVVMTQQEDHLDSMARHLGELGSLATNLNDSLVRHSNTLDSLEDKMETQLIKSNIVTRRTDRLIQKKSWTKIKPVFFSNFSIQHIQTGKYLSVSSNNSLILSTKYNEKCIFGLWKRQGKIFGLQNKYSKRWAGQNILGSLVCSATKFDRREEWDAEGDDWNKTPLLCTSAGWGNGGYLLVGKDDVISIGGGELEDKQKAALWCIKDLIQKEIYQE